MAPSWQKPENALRRAAELLEVGRKQDALDTLHDVIKGRKVRQWTKVHEQIMFKHLELCVELRKPHLAKDGLFQYRNMCQMVNAKSLEDVIQMFLELSEKKAEQARQESQGLVEDVEDLDQAESPEKLLLSAVTGEGTQERADRTILSPWLRFLWEAYRQCLELLRNNMQVETLYHRVAKQAFQFCLKYQRKAEFRKLCDNLRTHLNQIQKAQHHAHYALKLTNAETLAMHQETRLIQLDVAIQMELWQEAFKSVEDVHQLMHLSKRQARSSALASYYEKLALIFWKADNTLFHAAVLMKLFHLTKELKKSVSAEELSNLATRCLLAVLSVNVSGNCSDLSRHVEMEETFLENQRRLATLIMLPSPPTRQSLLKDVVRMNVQTTALPPAQKLYKLLETEFCPLTLASETEKQLSVLTESAKLDRIKYIECLKEVAASKILRQVSQIYSTAKFEFLCKIISFYDRAGLERLIVSLGKRFHFQVRLHHRTESVEFGLQDNANMDEAAGTQTVGASAAASAAHSSHLNVPIVQTMPGEQIRQHLQQMYHALQDATSAVDATELSRTLADAIRQRIGLYGYHKADQHTAILNRKKQIEAYKETTERIKFDQEEKQKEQERRINEQRQREIEARLQQEKLERVELQKRREQEELKQRIMQDRLDKLKDPKLRKILEEMPDTELDHDKILEKQIFHLEQEKREVLNKLKQQEKKWDYYVRAMHIEEIPLRETEYEKWAKEDVAYWEEYEEKRVEKAIQDHELLITTVDRVKYIKDDANQIIQEVKANRATDFQQRMTDWEKKMREKRLERLKERKEERKAKRRAQWLEEKKEAERKKKEDEERQRRELEQAGRRGQQGQQRRTYDQQPKEPSGADADQWARGQAQPIRERENRYGRPQGAGGYNGSVGGEQQQQQSADGADFAAVRSGGGPPAAAAAASAGSAAPSWRKTTKDEPPQPQGADAPAAAAAGGGGGGTAAYRPPIDRGAADSQQQRRPGQRPSGPVAASRPEMEGSWRQKDPPPQQLPPTQQQPGGDRERNQDYDGPPRPPMPSAGPPPPPMQRSGGGQYYGDARPPPRGPPAAGEDDRRRDGGQQQQQQPSSAPYRPGGLSRGGAPPAQQQQQLQRPLQQPSEADTASDWRSTPKRDADGGTPTSGGVWNRNQPQQQSNKFYRNNDNNYDDRSQQQQRPPQSDRNQSWRSATASSQKPPETDAGSWRKMDQPPAAQQQQQAPLAPKNAWTKP